MSEEVQDAPEVKEEEAAEASESDNIAAEKEAPAEAPAEGASEGSAKVKKINRISPEALNKKIEELEKNDQVRSKYYKHLVQRKKELEPSSSE